MELEVGMYVRTDMGIGKVVSGEQIDFGKQGKSPIRYREPIEKSSFNIIDLIEVGDILAYTTGNILKIKGIGNDLKPPYFLINDGIGEVWARYEWIKDDLVSILTHEQEEANAYKIGE